MIPSWLPGAGGAADCPREPLDRRGPTHLGAEDQEPQAGAEPPVEIALRACAAHLRRASPELAALPVADRAAGLWRVSRSWLDPDDELRREALELLPGECGLSARSVAWGLDRAFEVVTPEALHTWWRGEGGVPAVGLSGHVFAGNVFAAGLPPVLASLLAGVPALVKSASACPSWGALLARSVARHAPELGPCLGAAAWGRGDAASTASLLDVCDLIVAFGDDASLVRLRDAQPAGRRFAGFGHRYSVAVLGAELDDEDTALRGLARDHFAWDGAGCLTPVWTFVEGDAARARRLALRAAQLAPQVAEELPAAPLSEVDGARRQSWLARAAFGGVARWGRGWAVATRPPGALDQPPRRTLVFVPLSSTSELPATLAPLGDHLQGVAASGCAVPEAELESLGLSRTVAPGSLQRPPLAWSHDGHQILGLFVA